MTIYTIYAMPNDETGDSNVCIPSGFSWFAALLPPLWAVVNGAWLELVLWIIGMGAISVLSTVFGAPVFGLYLLGTVWLGFEANYWVGLSRVRRGYEQRAEIVARDALSAEAQFQKNRQSTLASGPSYD